MRIYKVYVDEKEIYSYDLVREFNGSYIVVIESCVVEIGKHWAVAPFDGDYIRINESVHTNLPDAKKYLKKRLVTERDYAARKFDEVINQL